MFARDGDNPLDYEIRQEKAAALRRIATQMEAALDAFRSADANDPKRRAELLEEAAEAVWFYILQREAMGLRQNAKALDQYDIPGEVRARIGPRRGRRTNHK